MRSCRRNNIRARAVACLTFNSVGSRNGTKRARAAEVVHVGVSAADDRRRDGDKQRYRWKRGNRTATVVLTNDLTPVWTVAFDEIRIISVGACQCKCHTYIQLPLVTLRSTAGPGEPGTRPVRFTSVASLYRRAYDRSARGSRRVPVSRFTEKCGNSTNHLPLR